METRRIGSVSAVAVVLLALGLPLACTSGSLGNGNPGAGGVGGTASAGAGAGGTSAGGTSAGGTGLGGAGAGGTSGDGTGVGGSGVGGAAAMGFLVPGCLADLFQACTPQGSCTYGSNDAGSGGEICFASGVHATFTGMPSSGTCGGVSIVTVAKADGTPCYSFESYVTASMACEGIVYTWKDATGAIVATGLKNPYNHPDTTISCAGSDGRAGCNSGLLYPPTDACCRISDLGAVGCVSPSGSRECTAGACTRTN